MRTARKPFPRVGACPEPESCARPVRVAAQRATGLAVAGIAVTAGNRASSAAAKSAPAGSADLAGGATRSCAKHARHGSGCRADVAALAAHCCTGPASADQDIARQCDDHGNGWRQRRNHRLRKRDPARLPAVGAACGHAGYRDAQGAGRSQRQAGRSVDCPQQWVAPAGRRGTRARARRLALPPGHARWPGHRSLGHGAGALRLASGLIATRCHAALSGAAWRVSVCSRRRMALPCVPHDQPYQSRDDQRRGQQRHQREQ